MFKWFREWWRRPQVGDIWVLEPDNPFDSIKIEILDVKGKYVKYKYISKEYSYEHTKPIIDLKLLWRRDV